MSTIAPPQPNPPASGLDRVRIVLVEPAGARNVGSVARVMKNFGLRQLVLVNPQCDPQGPEARQMAVHAADLLAQAQTVTGLPAALAGCQRAIATTDRPRTLNIPLEAPRAALPWLLEAPAALIFGPEDRGLNNQELNHAQRWVGIPTGPDYSSLNLAQAVAVCCYELHLSQPPAGVSPAIAPAGISTENLIKSWPPPPGTTTAASLASPEPAATLEELAAYYAHLEAVLLKIGYLYAHTAASRMQKFKRLYNRCQLSAKELAMLRGVLRQVEWAISPPSDPFSPGGSTRIAVNPVPIADTLDQSGSE
ncbi:RNA methyltransferase [Trichothermofontia sp.]